MRLRTDVDDNKGPKTFDFLFFTGEPDPTTADPRKKHCVRFVSAGALLPFPVKSRKRRRQGGKLHAWKTFDGITAAVPPYAPSEVAPPSDGAPPDEASPPPQQPKLRPNSLNLADNY